ncbi:QacE family quaternary ammonium compound efflux SMR transporter [Schaalia sp. ZJ405]|uniref:DMT family transporter n=1 Tax=unclassified Schaalia TaxID=2691889 RepID=UPI0013EDC941|nr:MULTISPECIES: SMR family transporter [unclassified Schaalia]QPK80763.1 QacE family quaternary ammonium compound efflux SMR transporter [Schaalia sp. ZJ405]
MSWLILIISGMFETVWASALSRLAEQFRWFDVLLFIAGSVVSLGGLMIAMKDIPVGTAYAAWAGTGAVVTVGWSILSGAESASLIKVILVTILVGCIVGLHLIDTGH